MLKDSVAHNNFYRLKLLNAILYFSEHTKRCNLTKLLKLLYLLDFTHFKQTARPSIGLNFYAWKQGPVPKDFYEEIKDGNVPEDFKGQFAILQQETRSPNADYKEYLFKRIAKPDETIFTPRELKILQNLSDVFRDATASQMSELTHLHKQPWDITIKEKGLYKRIDYLLCLEDNSPLSMQEAELTLKEYFEVLDNFDLNPTKKD
jgi:uncharacterized phage-associated protein